MIYWPKEFDLACNRAEPTAEFGTAAGLRLVIWQVNADTACLCWSCTIGSVWKCGHASQELSQADLKTQQNRQFVLIVPVTSLQMCHVAFPVMQTIVVRERKPPAPVWVASPSSCSKSCWVCGIPFCCHPLLLPSPSAAMKIAVMSQAKLCGFAARLSRRSKTTISKKN